MSDMTESEFVEYHNRRYQEVPEEAIAQIVHTLDAHLRVEDKLSLLEEYHRGGTYWAASFHFGWGMAVRNLLRDNGFTDDKFKSGNLDNYYVQLLERWIGAR